jgi:hypothetical protein
MRYKTVLQHGPTGPWHYVSASKDGGYPTEGCTETCTHATKDEAYEHHRHWILDEGLDYAYVDPGNKKRCEVCYAWTQRRVVGRGANYGDSFVLCNEHATREMVEERHHQPGQRLDSWGSG